MPTFLEISEKFKKIDYQKSFFDAMDLQKFKEYLIKTIQDRLFKTGIAGDGIKLRTDNAKNLDFYSEFTKNIKSRKNQKTSNVTLKDSSEFYNSFKVDAETEFYNITADFYKEDNHIFDNFTEIYRNEFDFENAILKLTEKEQQQFMFEVIFETFINNLKKQ